MVGRPASLVGTHGEPLDTSGYDPSVVLTPTPSLDVLSPVQGPHDPLADPTRSKSRAITRRSPVGLHRGDPVVGVTTSGSVSGQDGYVCVCRRWTDSVLVFL